MENPNTASTMPPDYLQRNKLLAAMMIPLSLILIFVTGASILGQLFAPPKLIADEIPLGLRIFQELLGFAGAVAGLVSVAIALISSLNVKKFFAAGNYDASVTASEKAQKYGKSVPLLLGMLGLLLVVKIVQTFFLGK